MISSRYVKYIAFSAAACAAFNWFTGLNREALGAIEFFLSVSYGVAFHSLVITRLPVFRHYYSVDQFSTDRSYRSFPNMQAAAVLSSIVTGGAAAGIYVVSAETETVAPFAFCAAIAAGLMSFYRNDA